MQEIIKCMKCGGSVTMSAETSPLYSAGSHEPVAMVTTRRTYTCDGCGTQKPWEFSLIYALEEYFD